jgi:hypothetical protein
MSAITLAKSIPFGTLIAVGNLIARANSLCSFRQGTRPSGRTTVTELISDQGNVRAVDQSCFGESLVEMPSQSMRYSFGMSGSSDRDNHIHRPREPYAPHPNNIPRAATAAECLSANAQNANGAAIEATMNHRRIHARVATTHAAPLQASAMSRTKPFGSHVFHVSESMSELVGIPRRT